MLCAYEVQVYVCMYVWMYVRARVCACVCVCCVGECMHVSVSVDGCGSAWGGGSLSFTKIISSSMNFLQLAKMVLTFSVFVAVVTKLSDQK